MLAILAAVAMALGSTMMVHDVSVADTQATQTTPVVEVGAIHSVEIADNRNP